MTTPEFDPLAPLPGPPDPWASTDTPSLALRAAVPHDRDDRGRAGHRATDPGAPRGDRRTGGGARGGRPRGGRGRRPDHRHRLRHVRACGARGGRDPARGRAGGRAAGTAAPWPRRPSSCPWTRRRPASSSASRTKAGPRRRSRRWPRPEPPARGRRLLTVSSRSPGAAEADPALVVETGELDQSWCHTVGYVSPMLAGGGRRGAPVRPAAGRRGASSRCSPRAPGTWPAPTGSPATSPTRPTCWSWPPGRIGRPAASSS